LGLVSSGQDWEPKFFTWAERVFPSKSRSSGRSGNQNSENLKYHIEKKHLCELFTNAEEDEAAKPDETISGAEFGAKKISKEGNAKLDQS
jgi:hypothetical protein